jgi:hypothetical protein
MGLQKGSQKRPIGAKICSTQPISGQKGVRGRQTQVSRTNAAAWPRSLCSKVASLQRTQKVATLQGRYAPKNATEGRYAPNSLRSKETVATLQGKVAALQTRLRQVNSVGASVPKGHNSGPTERNYADLSRAQETWQLK